MQIENGRYRLKKKLGQNRKSVTYLAFDTERRHDVALKQFPNLWQDDAFHDCFVAEMAKIAALQHEAIVPIYDYGLYDGQLIIASTYLSGGSLAERLANNSKLPEAETKWILQRVGKGLAAAHEQGVVHRHLTPSNILFSSEGDAYLADFGIVCGDETSFEPVPSYLSPEQAAGEPVDTQTDIYQLGTLLFQMLAGRTPFEAPAASSILHLHRYATVPSVKKFNVELVNDYDAVLREALAKQKADRFATVSALLAAWPSSPDLDVLSAAFMIADDPGEPAVVAAQPVQRRWSLWVGLLLLVVLLGGGFFLFRGQAAAPAPTPTPSATAEAVQIEVPAVETAVIPATSTATPTATATVTATPSPEPSPTASPTPTQTALPPTGTATPSPTPTETPLPTFTPQPQQILLGGLPATVQNPITLSWQGNPNSFYRVTVVHAEGGFSYTSDWIQTLSWTLTIPNEQFGGWNWFVEDNQGARSESSFFWFDPFPNAPSGSAATAVPTDQPPDP